MKTQAEINKEWQDAATVQRRKIRANRAYLRKVMDELERRAKELATVGAYYEGDMNHNIIAYIVNHGPVPRVKPK